jgi:hypothetical protein
LEEDNLQSPTALIVPEQLLEWLCTFALSLSTPEFSRGCANYPIRYVYAILVFGELGQRPSP